MNERIRLLAEQSGYGARWTTTEQFEQFMENFAGVLIQECISTIENAENGYRDYRNQIEDTMRDHCIWLIKQKFGVEL